MTMPTPLCPNRMQVHDVHQETPDVWTLALINHDFYPYQPGQHALVSIANRADILRAYTLSSSPGLSRFITLTVRRLDGGIGSDWLTQRVKPGDELWLSDAQGEFTCAFAASSRYLMLAAGCGITPIMSMTRWLLANRPNADIVAIYNLRDPRQLIFADEWRSLRRRYPQRLRLTLMAEQDANDDFLTGRISREALLASAPDVAQRRVMMCGPYPYMQQAEELLMQAGLAPARLFKERFSAPPQTAATNGKTLTLRHPLKPIRVPVGVTLLAALESHQLPVTAACRTGVCGSCKTRILSGSYITTSTMTLTPEEIAQGYVLACSCQLQGDVVLN